MYTLGDHHSKITKIIILILSFVKCEVCACVNFLLYSDLQMETATQESKVSLPIIVTVADPSLAVTKLNGGSG